jgi:RNA polymerase sigma-70 factor (ECF subfamily)
VDVLPARSQPPDEALLRAVLTGSETALEALYDRHATTIHSLAMRLSGDRGIAEEVVQETFLALWDRAELFDPSAGTVATWLRAIARHRVIDRHRHAARRVQATAFSSITDGHEDPAATIDWLIASGGVVAAGSEGVRPETAAIAWETSVEVGEALAVLPPPEREAILLAYRDGLSQSEIAHRLGWPLGTVKTRSRRALRRLRVALVERAQAGADERTRPMAQAGAGVCAGACP